MSIKKTREHYDALIQTAAGTVRKLLEDQKRSDEICLSKHLYQDQFAFAEVVTSATLRAHLLCLRVLGLTDDFITSCLIWASGQTVTLRFDSIETCTFLREDKLDLEGPKRITAVFGVPLVKHKTITTVSRFVWGVRVKWQLSIFAGTDVDHALLLRANQTECEVTTFAKDPPPKPQSSERDSEDVDITWFLRNAQHFVIVRDHDDCRTPRRNPEISEAFEQFASLSSWYSKLFDYFSESVFQFDKKERKLTDLDPSVVFIPILPLFETCSTLEVLLDEHRRSLEIHTSAPGNMADSFARPGLLGRQETVLLLVISHARLMISRYFDCVEYLEHLLVSALITAIGKRVTTADFSELIEFHLRQNMHPRFHPVPMSYHVRRTGTSVQVFDTEGTLSVEDVLGKEVKTFVRSDISRIPMRFAINAGASVSFRGQLFLHGGVIHDFARVEKEEKSSPDVILSLRCRARPFCPLVLVLGRIASSTELVPLHAVVLQNRDDLCIPLRLESIPSAQEFRDAIESLSPEQQRFCQAYRSMQLSHTLFAICTIPLKPQLEALLRVPTASLIKEMELCQQVMNLFLQYQIPPDLLSCDSLISTVRDEVKMHLPPETNEVTEKTGDQGGEVSPEVLSVRANVFAVQNLIAAMKQAELDEIAAAKRKADEERERKEAEERRLLEAEKARRELQARPPTAYDHLFKIVIVGDSGVGKSMLKLRFLNNEFTELFIPTIGVDFGMRNISVDGKVLRLQVWDTSGQPRFVTITHAYYRAAHLMIVVFDVTSEESFQGVRELFSTIDRFAESNTCKILVGSKCLEPARVVDRERAQQLADELGIEYVDCDAKHNYQVELLFQTAGEMLRRRHATTYSAPRAACCCCCSGSSQSSRKKGFLSFGGSSSKPVSKPPPSKPTPSSSRSSSLPKPSIASSVPASAPIAASSLSSSPSLPSISSSSSATSPGSSSLPASSSSSSSLSSALPSSNDPSSASLLPSVCSASSPSAADASSSLAPFETEDASVEAGEQDFTQLPSRLQEIEEEGAYSGVLRPTIIHPGPVWHLTSSEVMPQVSPNGTLAVDVNEQAALKRNAFSLLDAITQSGALCLSEASLHVLMLPVHRFDSALMQCVVEDNTNPIEPLQRSSLRVASVIFDTPMNFLLSGESLGT